MSFRSTSLSESNLAALFQFHTHRLGVRVEHEPVEDTVRFVFFAPEGPRVVRRSLSDFIHAWSARSLRDLLRGVEAELFPTPAQGEGWDANGSPT